MSGMPGPSSMNSRRTPRRVPFATTAMSTLPPPPYCIVLLPSSLAAVTIFVWSTSESPAAIARSRTACRKRTTSSPLRMGSSSSSLSGVSIKPQSLESFLQQRHAPLDVERGAHALEVQAQLHERDRHGGAHAHDHRARVEHPRHA